MTSTFAPATVTQTATTAWQYRTGYPTFAVLYLDPETGEDTFAVVRYIKGDDTVKGYLEQRGVSIHDENVIVEYLGT
jgi:hypothetical protein